MANEKSPEKIDIAIVGGGVSGVYCAWRLQQANDQKNKKLVVFEGSEHIGGRLLSVRPPGIPNMVAELGGMRILPAVQPLIKQLIEVLNQGLPLEKKIETYEFPVDQDQNIAYLRGKYLRLADFTLHPNSVPYNLAFLEKGGSAGTIIINAIEQIVPGITRTKDEQERRRMAQKAYFAGRPLYEQGFWNVLSRVISGEAYQLAVDAGGYNTTLTNWNAADAIPWFLADFGVDAKYFGFKQGFQQVPNTLAEFFTQAGGEIRRKHKVTSVNWTTSGVSLKVNRETIEADSLILAMPRRSLDLLAPDSPPLQEPMIQGLIGSVTPRPLFKLFTTYTNPWWRAAGYTEGKKFIPVESGRTVTDLPVRQTYYWPQDNGDPAREGRAMLMASYDDGANIGYWDGLRPRRRAAWREGLEVSKPVKPFYEKPDADNPWFKYDPGKPMVAEVNRQLGVIHGLSYTPDVCDAAFRDWGDDPFGGGWNSWNIGVESPKVRDQIVRPFKDKQLFICGEAYSDAQGWVEGALQTADMVLEKFGLKRL